MDLQLLKTFLEVAEHGSFAAASERLFVTQSAVSLRVQRLEDQLGRPLFLRSKEGVSLTPAGREFRGFAVTILRHWDEARQRVGAAEEQTANLAIGAQYSLWPRLGFRWLDRLREMRPDLALRGEMGGAPMLGHALMSGALQVVLAYSSIARPGLRAEPLIEDQLVLVAPWPDMTAADVADRYALVDWGPEFLRQHADALPALHGSRLVLGLGTLSARFIRNRAWAAYLPARHIRADVEAGRLFAVADAPVFAHPAWAIWREDLSGDLLDVARMTLAEVAALADEDTVELLDQI